jgi:hypothetical protein
VLLDVYVYFGRVAALFCTKCFVVSLRVKRFFSFGQRETDASLQACAYFGRIVALPRVRRFFSSVNSRPSHRSRRALTSAESWPCPASSGFSLLSTRDRRIAPGVRLLRPNRGPAPRQAVFLFGQLETVALLQACAYFGRIVALPRVKRFFSSVTTISDRLGVRAPKAIRAEAVTYCAEGHFGD